MWQSIPMVRARQLMQLEGEAYELGDLTAIHAHLLAGISRIVGAIGGIRLQCFDYRPGGGFDVRDGVDTGLDDDSRRRLCDTYYSCANADPSVVQLMARDRELQVEGTSAIRRANVVSDRDWYASAYVAEVRRPARINDTIYLGREMAPGRGDGVGFHRAWGDKPFTDEDVGVAWLYHQEVQSRFAVPGRQLTGVRLSPRERQILGMLLRGTRRKAIAAELGLSTHTIDDHIKSLYKRLGVGGLPELLLLAKSSRATAA